MDERALVGVRYATTGEMIDDLVQRRHATIMHIRTRERDVPQRGRLELPAVLWPQGDALPAGVHGMVDRRADVVEIVVAEVASQRILSRED